MKEASKEIKAAWLECNKGEECQRDKTIDKIKLGQCRRGSRAGKALF